MRTYFLLPCAFIVIGSLTATAQEELGTHLLRDVWQANKTNPALFPDKRIMVNLPGIYNSLYINNITYNDLVVSDANGNTVLDVDNAIAKLDDQNRIRQHLEIETLGVGLRLGKLLLSAGHSTKFNTWINYPKTLPQLIWQGNAQFIGQEVDFGADWQLAGYHELALGAAFQIHKQITIGARFKHLSGFGDVSTSRTRLQLRTDDVAYELALNADFQVNTTGNLEYNGLQNLTLRYDFGNLNLSELFNRNSGSAFDLGIRARFDKLDLAFSALDLGGQIQWTERVRNYSLTGNYEFRGLDVAQAILDNAESFGNALDSLLELYRFTETANSYTTRLPTRYYLSAAYTLNTTWRLGGVVYYEQWRGETFQAVAASANMQLLHWLNLGASYAFRSGKFDNLGINATANLGPLQLFSMTDNVLSALRPKDSNSANVRVGINLLFGKLP
ncbi:MAG TPA: DUF5723 family protein [Saprospiraceae bacterium]|nr:DUF5723 family protein [Saprospiraceae bacterium]HMP13983.1 DUF5723 family protein [Saprospiraceae bacterium]